jgi:hypothetical protein
VYRPPRSTHSHAADSELAGEVDESHLLRFFRLSISLFAPMKIRVTAITKTMKARAAGPNCPPHKGRHHDDRRNDGS